MLRSALCALVAVRRLSQFEAASARGCPIFGRAHQCTRLKRTLAAKTRLAVLHYSPPRYITTIPIAILGSTMASETPPPRIVRSRAIVRTTKAPTWPAGEAPGLQLKYVFTDPPPVRTPYKRKAPMNAAELEAKFRKHGDECDIFYGGLLRSPTSSASPSGSSPTSSASPSGSSPTSSASSKAPKDDALYYASVW